MTAHLNMKQWRLLVILLTVLSLPSIQRTAAQPGSILCETTNFMSLVTWSGSDVQSSVQHKLHGSCSTFFISWCMKMIILLKIMMNLSTYLLLKSVLKILQLEWYSLSVLHAPDLPDWDWSLGSEYWSLLWLVGYLNISSVHGSDCQIVRAPFNMNFLFPVPLASVCYRRW